MRVSEFGRPPLASTDQSVELVLLERRHSSVCSKIPGRGCNRSGFLTMLRLTREQRRLLAEKLPDTANVAAGVLVFGPFVGGQRLSATSLGSALVCGSRRSARPSGTGETDRGTLQRGALFLRHHPGGCVPAPFRGLAGATAYPWGPTYPIASCEETELTLFNQSASPF